MSLEKLGDFFSSNNYHKQSLQRIYLAHKIEKEINRRYSESVRVVVSEKIVTIICSSPAQASALSLGRRKLYGVIGMILPAKSNPKIRFKISLN